MQAAPAAPDPADFLVASVAAAPAMAPPPLPAPKQGLASTLFSKLLSKPQPPPPADDVLFDFASQLEGDGGLPGRDADERASRTVAALFAFLAQGHTATSGAFRSHVDRLVKFLAKLGELSAGRRQLVDQVLELAARGEAPLGDWLKLASQPGGHWKEIERAVEQARKAVKL
jgi:hypothetical protein